MARETGEFLNGCIRQCAASRIASGAVGERFSVTTCRTPLSLLATAARLASQPLSMLASAQTSSICIRVPTALR